MILKYSNYNNNNKKKKKRKNHIHYYYHCTDKNASGLNLKCCPWQITEKTLKY